ncbi:MAG: hypothetical protein ACPHET_02210 [Miltoncostaeaceae bacterium]
MEVTRIHEGLWRWAVAGAGGAPRAATYLEHGDHMVLVDPVLPTDDVDRARFHRAIVRDLARLGGAVSILCTHPADADEVAEVVHLTGGRVVGPEEPPPPGMQRLPLDARHEAAWWSARHRALMPGRALRVSPDGVIVPAPGVDAATLLAVAPRVVIPAEGPMVTLPAA